MDINPNSSSEPQDPFDPLAERLREEALAHRPPFSPELHDRILSHIHSCTRASNVQPTFLAPRLVRFAAAIAILGVLLSASWKAHSHRTSIPTPPNVIVKGVLPPIPVKPAPEALKFQIAGVISANLLPPRIEFQFPSLNPSSPDDSEPSVSTASTGLPERLLSGLGNPTVSAGESLNDVVPPNFRLLLALVQPAVHRAPDEPVH